MKKNWRQSKWSDFSKSQKIWFITMCIIIASVLIGSCLASSKDLNVPKWVAVCIMGLMTIVLYKFLKITPWALMGFDSENDEEDEEDEQ